MLRRVFCQLIHCKNFRVYESIMGAKPFFAFKTVNKWKNDLLLSSYMKYGFVSPDKLVNHVSIYEGAKYDFSA